MKIELDNTGDVVSCGWWFLSHLRTVHPLVNAYSVHEGTTGKAFHKSRSDGGLCVFLAGPERKDKT